MGLTARCRPGADPGERFRREEGSEAARFLSTVDGIRPSQVVAALIVILAFASAGRRKGVGAPERWWQGELAALIAVLLLAAVLVSLPPPA